MLIDYRCPRCNNVVNSRSSNAQEVKTFRRLPTNVPTKCIHCNVELADLKENPNQDTLAIMSGGLYYFVEKTEATPATNVKLDTYVELTNDHNQG